jgi:hypothetical protein
MEKLNSSCGCEFIHHQTLSLGRHKFYSYRRFNNVQWQPNKRDRRCERSIRSLKVSVMGYVEFPNMKLLKLGLTNVKKMKQNLKPTRDFRGDIVKRKKKCNKTKLINVCQNQS